MMDAGIAEDIALSKEANALWKDKPEGVRQKLRPYYQKHLSSELSWQKNPDNYTSGKLPLEDQTYIKPGFYKNLKYDGVSLEPQQVFDKNTFDYTNPEHRKQLLKQHEYLIIDKKDIVPKTTRAFHDPGRYSKLKQRFANLIEKRLIDYTGKTTKLSGKHFITSKGEITRPLSWHRTTLERSGIAPNVVGKRGMEGFLQKNNVVRIDTGIDYDGNWLEIEAEHKLTPQQSNIINSHIKKNKLKPYNVILKDKSTQVKKQLPKGFGLSNEELVNLERQEEQRRTHTQNLAGKLRQRIADLEDQEDKYARSLGHTPAYRRDDEFSNQIDHFQSGGVEFGPEYAPYDNPKLNKKLIEDEIKAESEARLLRQLGSTIGIKEKIKNPLPKKITPPESNYLKVRNRIQGDYPTGDWAYDDSLDRPFMRIIKAKLRQRLSRFEQ